MKENWIDRLVKQDYFSAVRRFTVAALLGVSSVVGSGAFVVMGVVAPLISGAQHYFEKKRKQKMLLNFYQDELGTLLHKNPEALTLEDLEKASKTVAAIKGPNEEYQAIQNQSIGIAVVSSLLTVAALLGATAWAGPALAAAMPNVLQLGLVTAGYMAIRNTVSATAHTIFGHEEGHKCVGDKLMDFAEHIKEKPINPVQLFGIFTEANPSLQQDIKRRFGSNFEDLSAIRKTEVVDAYEQDLRVIALTNAVNRDAIKLSLVGFIAYNQAQGLPDIEKYKALFSTPLAKSPALEACAYSNVQKDTQYAKRILAEREDPMESRLLN